MSESSQEEEVKVTAPFTCGAEVRKQEHEGPVVGCCYSCGLLLCNAHIYHMPFDFRFGPVDGVTPQPIACGTCAGPLGKPGLPKKPVAVPVPARSERKRFSWPFRLPSFRRSGRRIRKPKTRV